MGTGFGLISVGDRGRCPGRRQVLKMNQCRQSVVTAILLLTGLVCAALPAPAASLGDSIIVQSTTSTRIPASIAISSRALLRDRIEVRVIAVTGQALKNASRCDGTC